MTYLTDTEVREILKLWLQGHTQASLARRFNVSYGHINNIVWGRKRDGQLGQFVGTTGDR